MPLADLEKAFMGHLLKPYMNDSGFLSELLPVGLLDEEKQLSIYRSNINGAHQKVLAQIYPACLNILGEDYFNQLCRAYRFEYPSMDSDLNNYGEYFSVFIKEQFEIHSELKDFEYLAELAWLEWNWHASYYVKNDGKFNFDKLALIKVDDHSKLVLLLSDSFSLHSTQYPLLDIWEANKNSVDDEQIFNMPDSENYFCISRVNVTPEIKILNRPQYALLKYISNGVTLTQLNELHMNNNEKHIDGFQSQLMNFIQKGWVTGFSLACSG